MKYVDEFRDPEAAKKLLARIERDAKKLDKPIALMEVCGGHTHTIYPLRLGKSAAGKH